MREVSQAVHHRHSGLGGKFLDVGVVEGPNHDAVHETAHYPTHVGNRLALAESDLRVGDVERVAPELPDRYQHASELLDDLSTAAEIDHTASEMEDIRRRLRAREVPRKGFCWHCRKPLHSRSDTCAFCGEKQ